MAESRSTRDAVMTMAESRSVRHGYGYDDGGKLVGTTRLRLRRRRKVGRHDTVTTMAESRSARHGYDNDVGNAQSSRNQNCLEAEQDLVRAGSVHILQDVIIATRSSGV